MLWIFPHILASALIIYFFAYLTHKPHEVHERYRDTNIFWVKGKIMEPIVNWLYHVPELPPDPSPVPARAVL